MYMAKKKFKKQEFVCERCGNPIRPRQYKCPYCKLWRYEEVTGGNGNKEHGNIKNNQKLYCT